MMDRRESGEMGEDEGCVNEMTLAVWL